MLLYSDANNYRLSKFTDYDAIRRDIQLIDWNKESSSIEETWGEFRDVLLTLEEKHTQVKWNRKPKTLPFLTKTVKRLINQKDRAWKKYKKASTDINWEKFKSIRNKLRNETRNLAEKYENTVAKDSKTNPKKFWRYVSSKKPGRHAVPDLTDNGQKITDPTEKANLLNKQFEMAFSTDDEQNSPTPPNYNITSPMEEIKISAECVLKKLRKLDPQKSKGPDGLHPRLLKEVAVQIAEPLAKIFNLSLKSEKIPSDWKKAHVTPIHKKGKKDLPINYRPISITSVVCKILEFLINNAITKHLAENKLEYEGQHGFRTGRSVDSNLIESYDFVTKLVDLGFPVDIALFDLAKAFDKVSHRLLILKLQALGIHVSTIAWIKDFLTGRSQQVKIATAPGNSVLSEAIPVTSGVPQGSVLGPSLFNLYINDAPMGISSKITLYADDSKLMGSVENARKVETLQEDIDKLASWVNKWQLQLNVEKCKLVHIGSNNPKSVYTMTSQDGSRVPITSAEEERDLGVMVDNKLKFSNHAKKLAAKANQTLGIIKRTFTSRSKLVVTKLYKSLVRPKLEVGMSVASPGLKKDCEVLEKVQRRATKLVQGLKDKSYSERLQELSLPSLTYRRRRGDAIQTFKIVDKQVMPQLFNFSTSARNRGHSKKIVKPSTSTRARNQFFTTRVINNWNSLSEDTVKAETVDAFKAKLDREWSSKPWKYEWDAAESVTRN